LCLGDIAQIDTLVTVVDGSRFLAELDSIQSLREREWQADPEDQRTISHLLCDQVEFSNVITLNKCDLMNVDEKNQVKRLIKHMNPTAIIIESTFSKVPLDTVLGTGLFSIKCVLMLVIPFMIRGTRQLKVLHMRQIMDIVICKTYDHGHDRD